MKSRTLTTLGIAMTTAICALALAACGSGGGSSSESSSGGETIKLMAMGPIEAPQFSLPSIGVGAEAAVDRINEEGGIGGKQVDLIVCNDENDPNKAVACAREAITEEVAALVGGYTIFEPQVVPLIEKAGIPWVGPTAIQNSTSPNYFLLGGEGATLAFAMGLYFDQQHCAKTVPVGENLPTAKAAAQLVELGVAAGGGTPGEAVYGASDAADWGPVVAAATGEGGDCLALLTSATNGPKVVTAVAQSGEGLRLASPLSILPGESIKALGSAADGTILMSGYLPFSSGAPAVAELEAAARKIDPKVPLDAELESAYASVETFAKAVEGVPTVNAETAMKALPKLKGYDTGLGPVVDFTKTNPTKTFSRVVNTDVYVLEAKDGEVVLAQKQPLDTAPAFEALAKAGR